MNTLAETIYRRSIDLPEHAAREALDFVEFLRQRHPVGQEEQPEAVSVEPSPIYRAFEEAGLIGCMETHENLSLTYKDKLDFSAKTGEKL